MIEDTLKEIASSIDDLYGAMNPDNSFGQSLGDQLYDVCYQIQRIADILEKIETKM